MLAWLKHYVFSIEQTGVKREMELMVQTATRTHLREGILTLLRIHLTVQGKVPRVNNPLRKTTTTTSRVLDTRLAMRIL